MPIEIDIGLSQAGQNIIYIGVDVRDGITGGQNGTEIHKPTNTQTGDLLVNGVIAFETSTLTLPSGWAQIGATQIVGPGDPLDLQVKFAYHFVEASDTSWNWDGTDTAACMTHSYRYVAPLAPIYASTVFVNETDMDPDITSLTASAAGGDASVYMALGAYHQNINHPTNYAGRVENTASDYGSGDRLNLTPSQSTSGTLDCTNDTPVDRAIMHIILRCTR